MLFLFFQMLGLSALVEKLSLSSPVLNPAVPNPAVQNSTRADESPVQDTPTKTEKQPLPLPPPLELPLVRGEAQTFCGVLQFM